MTLSVTVSVSHIYKNCCRLVVRSVLQLFPPSVSCASFYETTAKILVFSSRLRRKAPPPSLSASKQSASTPTPPPRSCHCTPIHTLTGENSHTHTPNTHRRSQTQAHSRTHNFICSFAGCTAWQPTRKRHIPTPNRPHIPLRTLPTHGSHHLLHPI